MGCHEEVCSIREGDWIVAEAGGGGRVDSGRLEGGAFSMSDVDGEGRGVGNLGWVGERGDLCCSGDFAAAGMGC